MKRHSGLLLIFLVLMATASLAQDSQMWDSQYGTRAQLLGGLVVGAPSDLSSTYYNPAWLALEKQPGVLLTTKAFEAYSIKTTEALGRGATPSSDHVTPSPGYFGAKFNTTISDDKVAIAFSYMQRIKYEFDSSGIRVDDNPAPPPGDNVWFSGEAYHRVSLSEYWAGVTFAKRIGDNIYAGITPFAALRKQNQRAQLMVKGMDSDQNFAHYYDMDYSTYWHIRALAKAGLAFNYSPISFGLTLTTPSFGLFGDGSVHHDQSISGLESSPDGADSQYLAVNYQEGLSPNFKSPLSLAVGAAYHFGSSAIYFSSEWFNGTESFDILSPDSFRSQSNPETILEYDVSYAARPILNWGLAGKHQFTKTFTLYTSFWTDKSVMDPNQDSTSMMAIWNLWHLNMGASFEFMNIEFTSGLGYSYGSETTDQFLYFNPGENDDDYGDYPETEFTFQRLKFLIGFNLDFGTVEE